MRRLAILTTLTAALCAPAPAAAAPLPPSADFDGDGFSDLAIGAPTDSVQGQSAAGAVNVLYGGPDGLRARRDQQFTQASDGVTDVPEAGDRFGATLAAGDFDGDGYADLAVGVPGEGLPAGVGTGERLHIGMVQILHGSPAGLEADGDAGWTQDRPGVKGMAEAEDGFASALAAGDFDGDRRDDLAVGTPLDSVDGRRAAGAVNVLYGSSRGLRAVGDQLWTLDTPQIKGLAGANFRFGWTLAAGELSGNGCDDLAIGMPGATISGRREAGAVTVLYGRSGGLSAVDDLWSQDARGIKARAGARDNFGAALAIGDFDRDRIGDLAISAPLDDGGGVPNAGAVNVIYGSASGLQESGDELWSQHTAGIEGAAQQRDRFGVALIAADFSRDAAADLAIGVPFEDARGEIDAGLVQVLYGRPGYGLDARGDQRWTQDRQGVAGDGQPGDLFGAALAAGDFDADNAFDLAIAAPHDRAAGHARAGAVNVLYGSEDRLRDGSGRQWTQARTGVLGAAGVDSFGSALASGSR
jgi:hypothetical protein